MARQHTKQSTLFRSRSLYAPSPVLMVRTKPVKPWLVLTAVLCGFFMAVLDTTIMNIAIPSHTDRPLGRPALYQLGSQCL